MTPPASGRRRPEPVHRGRPPTPPTARPPRRRGDRRIERSRPASRPARRTVESPGLLDTPAGSEFPGARIRLTAAKRAAEPPNLGCPLPIPRPTRRTRGRGNRPTPTIDRPRRGESARPAPPPAPRGPPPPRAQRPGPAAERTVRPSGVLHAKPHVRQVQSPT